MVRNFRRTVSYSTLGAFSAMLISCGGGGDSAGPGATPVSISQASSTQLSGTAGSVLTPSPTFVVKDANGNILGGIPVTITVTSGNATLSNPPTTTSASGPTSVGTVTIGQQAGPSVITITVNGLPPLTITITGAAGPPASISIDAGFVASAFAGTSLVPPIAVRDQFGNGVANVQVTLVVAQGGGNVTPATVTSGADGHLNGVAWTLGKSAVPQTITASGGGVSSTLSAAVATNYVIDLRFFGPAPPAAGEAAFVAAAARIKGSIVGTFPLLTFPPTTNPNLVCKGRGPDITGIGSTTGLVIYATVVSIDGPNGTLARSGPCLVRTDNNSNPTGAPVLAAMEFDADDINALVANGQLASVVLHEMLHAVGVGSIWNVPGRTLLNGEGGPDPRFVGPLAMSACTEAGGVAGCAGGVAVENCVGIQNCGAGTRDGHWRELTFNSEIMTGFVENPGVQMPFSKITIQSLADLGYTVNLFASDPYSVPAGNLMAAQSVSAGSGPGQIQEAWETMFRPGFAMRRNGVIVALPK